MNIMFVSLLCNAILVTGRILSMLILVRIILSWVRIGIDNPITQFIYNITELFLSPIRNLIAKSPLGGPGMMLDFSPLICMIMINILSNMLVRIILTVF